MTLKALVVGLGQVGMGYDLNLGSSQYILTHSRAFQQHPQYRLVGGVDSDAARREEFERHYQCPAYENLTDAVNRSKPDVIAIGVPTAKHGEVLNLSLATGRVRAILCEKPLAFRYSEARGMVEACAERNVALFVNYSRRSEPGALEVKRRIHDELVGTPLKGIVWYSKGLFNNGSHFLNLLEDWLGETTACRVLESGRRELSGDPEPDVEIKFRSGTIYFLALRDEDLSHRCMELIGPRGRLRYEAEGTEINWTGISADPVFPAYRILSSQAEVISTDSHRSLWHVVEQLSRSLAGRPADICCGSDALRTLKTLSEIDTLLTRQRL